jgi:hypothetical protein
MPFEEVVAENWGHAIELLYANSWREDLQRHRSHLAFRGLSDATYGLQTSLIRLGGPFAQLERHLIRNFCKYARRGETHESSDWKWLTIGQHYGLPTRLLDWTYSPFAALHFCTSNMEKFSRDAAIWCVEYTGVHRTLPEPVKRQQSYSGSDLFTVGMLERAASTLSEFDTLAPEPFAVFFEPPSLDDRIVNQFALFSVLSDPSMTIDTWLARHPELCRRIIIPARIKWEIRDKLDQANMTERVFFPGLDGLAAWLRRHYSPRALLANQPMQPTGSGG